MVIATDFGSRGPGFESCCRQNLTLDYTVFHYTEPFIITFPSFQYDLNNFERDLKHQIIIYIKRSTMWI